MEGLGPWSVNEEALAQGLADVFAWVLLAMLLVLAPLVALCTTTVQRRRFWCPLSRREVEVEFEVRALPAAASTRLSGVSGTREGGGDLTADGPVTWQSAAP